MREPCNTGPVLHAMMACPDCPTARDARAMFVEVDLGFNAVVAVLPFAVCIAAVLIILQLAAPRSGASGAAR